MKHEVWRPWRGRLNGVQKFGIAVGAFLVLALAAVLYSNYIISRQMQAARAAYRAEIEVLTDENTTLMGKLASLNDETYALREKLEIWQDLLLKNDIRIDRMGNFYRNRDPYQESLVENDAEFLIYCRKYYPEAVYNFNTWTAAGILRSYAQRPEIWGFWPEDYSGDGFYFAWTPDGQHCLIIDPELPRPTGAHEELSSGWVVVDGVRIYFYGETRAAIDPTSLAEAYRNGEWDGSPVRSADWGTTVCVNGNGCLEYDYMVFYYDETMDPEGLAYTGYEEPWWAGNIEPEIAALIGEASYYPTDEQNKVLAFGGAIVRMPED